MKTEIRQIDGHEMAKIIKTISKTEQKLREFSLKKWGDKPTKSKKEVDINQFFKPLASILEKYTDLESDQRRNIL